MVNLMITSASNFAGNHLHAWLESMLKNTKEYIPMMLVHKSIMLLLAALYAEDPFHSEIVRRCSNPARE
jgi:hypothetical protein